MQERERKKRNKKVIFSIVLIVVFVVVLFGVSYYKSKNVNSDNFSPPNHPPITIGTPGFGAQTNKCALSNGNIKCADVNGDMVPYHCGEIIRSESDDSDVHTDDLYCDAEEVHCPDALEKARKQEICPNFCPKKTELGSIQTPICFVSAPDELFTMCIASIYYTCTLPSSGEHD